MSLNKQAQTLGHAHDEPAPNNEAAGHTGHPEHPDHSGGHGGHTHKRGFAALLTSHHHDSGNEQGATKIVFVGNPNVGKSTLFNAVLGANAAVMNAPGTTVLVERGYLDHDGEQWDVLDTPGTASLDPLSPDEEVAANAAIGIDGRRPDVIVIVVDATSLSRSLYLLSQVVDLGSPVIVALTMVDLARKQGLQLNIDGLGQTLHLPVVVVDGRTGRGKKELVDAIYQALANPWAPKQIIPVKAPTQDSSAEDVSQWVHDTSDARFDWIAGIVGSRNVMEDSESTKATFSDKLDKLLLHPAAGIAVFLAVMYAVFEATTVLAGPFIDWFDVTFRSWLTTLVDWGFTLVAGKASLAGWFHSLIVDGFLDGVVTVTTFIPPMAIMFLILSLLEDSGYLARAAFVMDRAMRMIGLDGRAFLPLVVGFGCNLPALAATRTLPDSRQRLMTGLLVPFTSCSARLSVYIVLAYAFFGNYAGLAIFLMYVSSIAIILLVGFVMRSTQFRELHAQPFAMGLPPYQIPKLIQLVKSVWSRLWAFITGASSIIISMIVVLWFLSAIPISAGAAGTNSFGNVDNTQDSAYGAVASFVAPVFTPAGFNDWHASAALITGFVAKEVVVGSMSQSYAINAPTNSTGADQGRGTLGQAVKRSFEKSSNGHGAAAAAAFMIFVLAYTPCLATVAEIKRQFGGKAALQSVGMGLLVAYVLAIMVFQIGSLL